MSRSSRRELASAIGAGLIILALLLLSIGSTALEQQRKNAEARAEEAAAEHHKAGLDFALLSEEGQRAATYEGEQARQDREKGDLEAQWATANWSFGQLCVGILGLFGLGATVLYARAAWLAAKGSARADYLALKVARRQLQEARSAALESSEISKGQSRAYVRVTGGTYEPPATIDKMERDHLFPQGRINLQLENFGTTVARDVVIRCEAVGAAQTDLNYADPHQFQTRPTSIAPSEKYTHWFRPNDGVFVTMFPENEPWCLFRGEVQYSDIYRKRFRSCFVLALYRGTVGLKEVYEFRRPTLDAALAVFDPIETIPALAGEPNT